MDGIKLIGTESPCLNCELRHFNCHSECKKYKAFRNEIKRIKKATLLGKRYY